VSGLSHADWLASHRIDASPKRSRFLTLHERISELERLAERHEDWASRAPDAGSRQRHGLNAERRRRQIALLFEELDDGCFKEPIEAGVCWRCGVAVTAEQLYATGRTCARCSDPYLSQLSTKEAQSV
jgi:hypothetical protein